MDACPTPSEWRDYAAGSIEPQRAAKFREHLVVCRACRSDNRELQDGVGRHVGGDDSLEVGAQTESLEHGPHADVTVDPPPQGALGWARDQVNRSLPRIDGYRILGVLGQGGMGIVYRAVETALNREVALKVLPAMVGSASASAVERFRREARAAADLHHTNIIPIYRYGESHDAYYYAMELVNGKPLSAWIGNFKEHQHSLASPAKLSALLRGDPMDADGHEHGSSSGSVGTSSAGRGRVYYQQVAAWVADAADALHHAHGKGVVHRDIKPSNLILATDGRIMVADFGLAKTTTEESITLVGSLLGTVRYLSPEQAMAKRVDVDHRTDIYSLGATMYELLCFQPAFPGNDEKKILAAIISRDPTPPHKVKSGVPAELETICLKTLEKWPDARYATARAMAEDLRRYLADLPINAKRAGVARRALKFARRHKAAVVAGTAIVLLVAVSGWLYSTRQGQELATIRALISEAESLVKQEKWDDAYRKIERALEYDSSSATALLKFAWANLDHFKHLPSAATSEALTKVELACRTVLTNDPDNIHALNYLAVILNKQGNVPEAMGAARRVTEIAPERVPAWTNLGAYHAVMNQMEDAKKCLQKAVELVSGQSSIDPALAVEPLRSLAAVEVALRDRAVELADRAASIKTDDIISRLVLARASSEIDAVRDWKNARKAARAAEDIATKPNPRVMSVHALILLRGSDRDRELDKQILEEAAAKAESAADLDSNSALPRLILAVCHARLGKVEAAREHLAQADALWPAQLKAADHWATYSEAVLWIESASVWNGLRSEVTALLMQLLR